MKVGVYHYWRGTSSAIEQAQNVVRTLGDKHIDCKIAIDVEQIDGLSNKELNNSVLQLAEELERLIGAEVCIYCNTNYARNVLDSRLGKYSLWVAHYGVNKPGDNLIWDNWAGFQYSDSGTSNVNGSLDLDEFTEEIFINGESQKVTENTPFSTNARAKVALDPRSNPSSEYDDLGEIYAGERIQVLAEVCDREEYLPIKYWKDALGCESSKVWVNSNQDYLEIDTNARSFNIVTELDARYEPSVNIELIPIFFISALSINKLYITSIESDYSKSKLHGDNLEILFFIREILLLSSIPFLCVYMVFYFKYHKYEGIMINLIYNIQNNIIELIVKYQVYIFRIPYLIIIIIILFIHKYRIYIINEYKKKLYGVESTYIPKNKEISTIKFLVVVNISFLSFIISEDLFETTINNLNLRSNMYGCLFTLVFSIFSLMFINNIKKIENEIIGEYTYIIYLDNNLTYTCNMFLELKNDYLLIKDDNEVYVNKNFVKMIRKIENNHY